MKGSIKESNGNGKRIAFFSVHGDPLAKMGSVESGGQNVYVYETSRWLAKRGWNVDVYTRLSGKKEKPIKKIGRRVNVIRLSAGEKKFIPKEQFVNNFEEFFTNFLYYKKENKLDYEMLFGHYWDGGWVAMRAAEILNVPWVEVFHSLGYIKSNTLKKYHRSPANGDQEHFDWRINLEKEIIKNCSKVIAESPYEEEDLIALYQCPREKIFICPAGVDISRFTPKEKDKAKSQLGIDLKTRVILYVGRLEWRKGIGTLLVGSSQIINRDKKNKYQILIVGGDLKSRKENNDKKEEQRLLEIAKSCKIDDCVRFEGAMPRNKIKNYYAAADLCVVPSYYEPFGIVPLEAMAMKIPVIASETGGLQYSVINSETGLLAAPRDPFDLAEKIKIIFRENALVKKMAENAYSRVKKEFCWKKIAKDLDEQFSQIIKENKK